MSQSYQSSFWTSGTLLAGLNQEGSEFLAYVLDSANAVLLESQRFPTQEEALRFVHSLPGEWVLENVAGCGEGKCGSGECGTGACGTDACPGVCSASVSP